MADGSYQLAAVCAWLRDRACDVGHLRPGEMCRLLGVSAQALSNFQERGCPRNAGGTFDATAVVPWRLRELEKRAEDARKVTVLDAVRVKKTLLDVQQQELDLAERRGDVVDRSAVVAGLAARWSTLVASVLGWVGRMSARGVPAEIVADCRQDALHLFERLGAGQIVLGMDPAISGKVETILREIVQAASPASAGPPAAAKRPAEMAGESE